MSTVVAVEYLSLDGGSWQRAAPVHGGQREQQPEAGENPDNQQRRGHPHLPTRRVNRLIGGSTQDAGVFRSGGRTLTRRRHGCRGYVVARVGQ